VRNQALQAGVQNVTGVAQLVRQGWRNRRPAWRGEGDGALEIGGGGEGEVLVRLATRLMTVAAGDGSRLPAGEGKVLPGAADA